MLKKQDKPKSIADTYGKMQKGYNASSSSHANWEMRNGMYVHYTAFQNEKPCFSGIGDSLKAL